MHTSNIRTRFLEFFQKREHVIIPSASLVTSDEKSVTNPTLFNTAGMQPLVPYLLGKPYMIGNKEIRRLVNIQKCLRTVDIDEVGDKKHATFFEMMGNWSLGDYSKKETIGWSYEFLTSREEGLGLDPNRLYVTVFEGDNNAPRDNEVADIWQHIFKTNNVKDGEGDTTSEKVGKIFFMPKDNNWWEAGDDGPCGPDTEMYYDVSNKFKGGGITKKQFSEADSAGDIIEVWNDVFMQYEKKNGKITGKLTRLSVDTGAGLERLAMIMQNSDTIYDTDLFRDAMEFIKGHSDNWELRPARIIADHVRASTFLIASGISPANTGRGYILRRLIRRAVRYADILNMSEGEIKNIASIFAKNYKEAYPELYEKREHIQSELQNEEDKFRTTAKKGLTELNRLVKKQGSLTTKNIFDLYQTYGLPLELTREVAREKNLKIDTEDFDREFKKHQELSRVGAEKKFKSGLADDNNPQITRYHTATHLLHQALHDVFGNMVAQKGSNITAERLRFDFTHKAKMTNEEKKKVEDIVNEKISQALPVKQIVMSREEAENVGAYHFFGEKYGDQISIYFVGDNLDSAYSKEFCGGPHVKNTSELAGPEGKRKFKIQKEEAVAEGVRRIRAVLML